MNTVNPETGEIIDAPETIYARWANGMAGPAETLRALCLDLAAVEAALAPLDQRRQALRNSIAAVVNTLDQQRTEIDGFGRLEMTAPAIIPSYDRDQLDRMVLALTQSGQHKEAALIMQCRKETTRASHLHITREKSL